MNSLARLTLVLLIARTAHGFCPKGCECDDARLRVVCANSTLDVLPIALNTRIEHIRMSFNKIRIVDASFQVAKSLIFFYLNFSLVLRASDLD